MSSAVSAINAPARRTFIPSLLPAGQLAAGLALSRLSFQIMLTAGPAMAGLIAAAPGLGLRACYLIDAASFAAALYGVARLPALPLAAAGSRRGVRSVVAGVRYIGRTPVLMGAFLADLNATIFGLPVALFPAINAERFGGDPRTLGLFTAAIGVGGLISATLSGPVGRITRQGRAMLAGVSHLGGRVRGLRDCGHLVADPAHAGHRGRGGHLYRGLPGHDRPADDARASSAAGSPRPTTWWARAAASSATWRPEPWAR